MTSLDLAGGSGGGAGTGPGGGAGTGPTPTGPPTPTPQKADDIYAVAQALGFGDLQTPARQVPQAGGPAKPDLESRHAGGLTPVPGVVSGFSLPEQVGPPRFDGDGPPRPGHPGPPPPPPPTPYPPPFQVGVGPQYDALPKFP